MRQNNEPLSIYSYCTVFDNNTYVKQPKPDCRKYKIIKYILFAIKKYDKRIKDNFLPNQAIFTQINKKNHIFYESSTRQIKTKNNKLINTTLSCGTV